MITNGKLVLPTFFCLCFFASILFQKVIWNVLFFTDVLNLKKHKQKKVGKTNLPFVITRYRDWVQLQLGASVLGLATSDINTSTLFAQLLTAYFFVLYVSH